MPRYDPIEKLKNRLDFEKRALETILGITQDAFKVTRYQQSDEILKITQLAKERIRNISDHTTQKKRICQANNRAIQKALLKKNKTNN